MLPSGCADLNNIIIKTNNVVVLMPPAILIGDPPINIKTFVSATLVLDRPAKLIVEKPAVRVVMLWKKQFKIL